MQRSSEFPLFVQTTIALFGFLVLISVFSSFTTPKTVVGTSSQPAIEIAKN